MYNFPLNVESNKLGMGRWLMKTNVFSFPNRACFCPCHVIKHKKNENFTFLHLGGMCSVFLAVARSFIHHWRDPEGWRGRQPLYSSLLAGSRWGPSYDYTRYGLYKCYWYAFKYAWCFFLQALLYGLHASMFWAWLCKHLLIVWEQVCLVCLNMFEVLSPLYSRILKFPSQSSLNASLHSSLTFSILLPFLCIFYGWRVSRVPRTLSFCSGPAGAYTIWGQVSS